jgi:hypothetical protein
MGDRTHSLDAALSGEDRRRRHVIIIILTRTLPPDSHGIDITEEPSREPERVPRLVGEVL